MGDFVAARCIVSYDSIAHKVSRLGMCFLTNMGPAQLYGPLDMTNAKPPALCMSTFTLRSFMNNRAHMHRTTKLSIRLQPELISLLDLRGEQKTLSFVLGGRVDDSARMFSCLTVTI